MKTSVKQFRSLATALTAVLLACLVTGVVMACLGYPPLSAYYQLVFGSVGGKSALCESIVKATPLILTGLSFAVAFKVGMINLGATGQVYMGALCTTLAATGLPDLPAAVMIPLALLAGIVGGMLPGTLVGFLKNRFQANELITTIMLNQIAVLLVNCLVDGPMKDMGAISLYPQSRAVAASAELPRLVKGTRLHSGLLIALAALLFYGFFLWKIFVLEVVFRFQTTAGHQGVGDADGSGAPERHFDVEFIILLQKGAVNDMEDVVLMVGPVFFRQLYGDLLQLVQKAVRAGDLEAALQRRRHRVLMFLPVLPEVRIQR